MKQQNTHRTILAWLLIAILTLPFAAQTCHIYLHEAQHALHGHTHETDCATEGHDCSSCAICQFHFYSFTEAAVAEPTLLATTHYTTLSYNYQERDYSFTYHVTSLRAPPALS